MKMTIRILSVFLALLFLCCGTALAQSPSDGPKEDGIIVGVTLEKVAEYPVPDQAGSVQADLGERAEGMMKDLIYTGAASIRLLRRGFYVVDGSGVNHTGLFDGQGTLLIPFEAAVIRELDDHSGEDTGRYLSVYYATEQTTDRTKALLYLSDGSWVGGSVPADNDVMYEGFIRFYDLELRRFVPGLEGGKSNSSCGSLLVIDKKVYDASGTLLAEKLTPGNGCLIRNTVPAEVYDETLTLRFTSDLKLSVLRSTGGYLLQYDADRGYRVVDLNGDPVVDDWFKTVTEEKYGILNARRPDGTYVLLTVDGQVFSESPRPIMCLAGGYYYTDDGGSFSLVRYDGLVVPNVCRPQGSLQVFDKESGTDAHTLVLNTGEMTLPFGRGRDLGIGLMGAYAAGTKKLGVVDLFTGETLLPFEYDDVSSSGGLIYVTTGGTRQVFRPCYSYR